MSTALQRIRVELTGFLGAPGVATFYALDAAALLTPLHDFWEDMAPGLVAQMDIQVVAEGDIITDTTGALTGAWVGTGQASVSGADGGVYPAPAGACVTWATDAVLDGARLKGRTYVVPLGGGSYQDDGSINTINLNRLRAAADLLVTAGAENFRVWHRPRKAREADGSRPAVEARDGGSAQITSATVADKVAILRSRRP